MGLAACHWTKNETKQCEDLYPIILDLQEKRFAERERKGEEEGEERERERERERGYVIQYDCSL